MTAFYWHFLLSFVACHLSVPLNDHPSIHLLVPVIGFDCFFQLMQHVSNPPALTCDPVRLVEEFPRWLEKVSAKSPGGVILVLDSVDRFPVS